MDAAAKHIQLLRSDILPPRPYQLAKVLDQRFRVPPDNLKLYEERQFRPLQYMTLINADRGLLFTRAYYDMREEPPKPNAAKEGLANSEKKPKTKLSLSDYKNKKKAPSNSPPDSTPTTKPSALRKEILDGRPERDVDRRDDGRDTAASRSRGPPPDERPAPKPEPRARHDPNDTPEKRKRAQEDDAARLPKRPRPDVTTPLEDRSRTPREDTPRRREDRPAPSQLRDSKSGGPPSLPNGRGMLKSALGSQAPSATTSSRPRGESLNGNRPAVPASNKVTPSKQDSSHKTTLPPLLSPLHFSIAGDESSPAKEKRRLEDAEEPSRAAKPVKPGGPVPQRREKTRLPALLSPTLPPQVEEELALDRARQRKESSTSTSHRSTQPQDTVGAVKKPRPSKEDDREERDRPRPPRRDRDKEDSPERLLVTFRFGKQTARMVKRILALPPRKERATSVETPGGIAAGKRPPATTEYIGDSIAVKRPRMSDVTSSTKLPPPSTPAKSSTAMARATSHSSQVHTPGDVNIHTPGDRPPTRQDPVDPARIRHLRERHERFKNLGNKLKHRRDDLLSIKNGERPTEKDFKLGMALCLESTMSYMVSFRAIFESRRLENKAQDPKTWDSILPMLDLIRHDVGDGRQRSLDSLYHHLRGVILEELIKCYWSLDPASNARNLMQYERSRSTTWKAAADAARHVKSDRMKTWFGPWTGAEEAVVEGLKVLRRWALDEKVEWRAEVTLQMNGA